MNDNSKAQLNLIGIYEIILGGKTVSYTLKRSSKARLIWLNIKRKTGLAVTVPHTYNIKYLPEYLTANSQWILRNLTRYCTEAAVIPQTPPHTANTISYLGKSLKVTQTKYNAGIPPVKLGRNKLMINHCPTDKNLSSGELEHWLKEQASRLINTKAEHFAGIIGVLYNRITVRDQSSRWGSCSCRKNLNFNWRLIMAPEPVLDYVIIHELCHLKDMSHSTSFWSLVSLYCPQWHEHRDWLDNHCQELNANVQF